MLTIWRKSSGKAKAADFDPRVEIESVPVGSAKNAIKARKEKASRGEKSNDVPASAVAPSRKRELSDVEQAEKNTMEKQNEKHSLRLARLEARIGSERYQSYVESLHKATLFLSRYMDEG